ncbi:2-hydroxyacid dehydrogenase [Mesorhizobium sp. SP-1A]|uniref:2-hydroxyacid dehydrogenase n=1 Tax=Mesorhizobium sp. SP-1A TaxID=3077840 RepID=UPI0028F718CB|nr:NAD(P)-dependent oxidoreductase [Mesorhizobium sp. SP-1A]
MYEIGISRDFLNGRGEIAWGDIGLSRIEADPRLRHRMIGDGDVAENFAGFDAVLVLRQRIDQKLLDAAPRLRHVSRWGAGLDRIDLDACTRAGVMVTSTPLGGKVPVAVAALTFVLTLTHRVLEKDRLVREGRWAERADYMGMGLAGRTIGIVGLGNIGREFARLAAPFQARLAAYSPRAEKAQADALGVELVGLDQLMERSDIVVVTAALTPATQGMISAERIARMKPGCIFVNVARGEIVDEDALIAALKSGRIARAGLDVFREEPLAPSSPLMRMDNVLLAPHALAWTDQIISGNAVDAIGSLLSVAANKRPGFIANPQVLDHPRFADMSS